MGYYNGFGNAYRYGHGFMGSGAGITAHIVGIILLIAFVIFIIKMFRYKSFMHTHQTDPHNFTGNALQILNERYAKGEIDDEEYQRKKAEISKP